MDGHVMDDPDARQIHVLPDSIRDQIAAGEVVERPASVVKELIENALDAGARHISIEVRDAGLGLIRVSDDGSGMGALDAAICVERFATSKVHTLQDLQAIRTLGFRGEALSSIAAVAQIEILTRAAGTVEGTRVTCAEGTISATPAASPVGTSVTVRGLYATVPARRRFLKSRSRETELIQHTVSAYALGYPRVAFRLSMEGRERLIVAPSTPLARVGAVLGREVAGEMLPIKWEALDLRLEGLISRPTIGRSRRSAQYFYVNGRPIQPGLLAVMLERPYAGRLFGGQRPLAVVHVTLDPHDVDVNVHPRKLEVRFSHERTVYTSLARVVSAALDDYPRDSQAEQGMWPFAGWAEPGAGQLGEVGSTYTASPFRALAQLHYTYILAQTFDGLAIADQHAAHEQVLFEQLSSSPEPSPLVQPARVDLTLPQMDAWETSATALQELGIHTEPFGMRAILVRALPAPLHTQEPVAFLRALLDEASSTPDQHALAEHLAMKAACLGAVKAGDPLSTEEMQSILDNLADAWSPATCPHGRPAVVSISIEELHRRFSRA
ncbi:MAG: DNA mismatch repair endonuclease MutL [Anaerolineae bacterium]